MSRLRTALAVLAVLSAAVLSGCGSDDVGKPKAAPTSEDTAFVEVTPSPTPTPTATATPTGPSGETPQERRDTLGGCPADVAVARIAGGEVTSDTDEGDDSVTTICRWVSTEQATYQGTETAEVEISVSEPVALRGGQDLAAYRREVGRSNPSRDAAGLGAGAFYSYFEESPVVCAVWFKAADGKVLTVSAVNLRDTTVTAGPSSPACGLAGEIAQTFRT